MNLEEQLRKRLAERAGSVRTVADVPDLARRLQRADRSSLRGQRAALVASLVVVAGSAGGVVGAFVSGPGGVPVVRTADSPQASQVVPPAKAKNSKAAAAASAQGRVGEAPASNAQLSVPASTRHTAHMAGLSLEWLVTPLSSPVEVLPGSGQAPVCGSASAVALTVGSGSPIAAGSGVVGLPSLSPQGLAVVSSGSFGSPGRPAGWWAIVEAGSAATGVAVQFPSGTVVRERLSGGVAVLAGLVPAGQSPASLSDYASAVADGSQHVTSSLEFLLGGGVAAVGASSGTAGAGAAASGAGCPVGSALWSAHGGPTAIGPGNGSAAGPPAPLMAAGDVVGAFEQAYDVNPLLGLSWNFSAVDLGGELGCPTESLPASTSSHEDGLSAPDVAVEAVAFTSPSRAVVVYQRGSGLLETGTANLVDGSWKVSATTYCSDMVSSGTAP